MQPGNLFADLPDAVPDEVIETLVDAGHVRVERITSRGQASPAGFWYDQPTHEWVVLLRGRARLEVEGGADLDLAPGAHVLIPAHRRHRVAWTSEDELTIWLAIHWT